MCAIATMPVVIAILAFHVHVLRDTIELQGGIPASFFAPAPAEKCAKPGAAGQA